MVSVLCQFNSGLLTHLLNFLIQFIIRSIIFSKAVVDYILRGLGDVSASISDISDSVVEELVLKIC